MAQTRCFGLLACLSLRESGEQSTNCKQNSSLNILQIISGQQINGALTYCKLLTQQLIGRGHRVTIVCRSNSWIKQQSLDVQFVDSNLKRFPISELRKIAGLVRDKNIDVVHTHMSRAHAFGTLLKFFVPSVPVIKSAHSRSVQLHWRFNDFVIANSAATEQYHIRRNGISPKKIQAVHCFIDTDKFQPASRLAARRVRRQLKWNNGEFLVGVVGEITKRKGQEFLVKAIPSLIKAIPHLRVVMVGRFSEQEPYVKQIRRYLSENGLEYTTQLIGIRDNVEDFLTAMNVSIVPSLEEPLGLAAIESQSVGTPVIVSETGGLTEVVNDEMSGLIVPMGDPDAISRAIIRLSQDIKLQLRLSFHGQEMVADTFSPEILVPKVESIYENLLSRRRKAA